MRCLPRQCLFLRYHVHTYSLPRCHASCPSQPRKLHWLRLRSEEHTSELQSQSNLVCRLLLEKKTHTIALAVRAGDAITATLTQKSGNSWVITINNDTTKENYSVTVQYSSSNSSAE